MPPGSLPHAKCRTESPSDLAQSLDALRRRDCIPDLDREKRFWRTTTVGVDEDFRVFVTDAVRFRVQVYRKTFNILSPASWTRWIRIRTRSSIGGRLLFRITECCRSRLRS